jgi:hypothetical protein
MAAESNARDMKRGALTASFSPLHPILPTGILAMTLVRNFYAISGNRQKITILAPFLCCKRISETRLFL